VKNQIAQQHQQEQQEQQAPAYSDNDGNMGDDSASMRSVPFSLSSRNTLKNNPDLNEPLNNGTSRGEDDPFYVFREDLYRKLDLVDEGLTEYLRLVHQTVRCFVFVVIVDTG
jgi:hypothetical protein